MITDTLQYWQGLLYYFTGGSFSACPYFKDRLHASIHVFSVALDLKLWSKKHYRKSSYSLDLVDNLRNVAIPGTGMPLSYLAHFKFVAASFYLFVNPWLCFIAALNDARVKRKLGPSGIAECYREHLLEPQNWYNFWRINSRLAAWHGYVTEGDAIEGIGYDAENKWDFLKKGEEVGCAITPFKKEPKYICKHKNEEGGLGIMFFDNAVHGGDWIIQTVLTNDKYLTETLLPPKAPLSTFRVLTASEACIQGRKGIKVLSCVLRAGRANALTDHSAVMFNVDKDTGEIGQGLANSHWYQVGLFAFLKCPWSPPPSFTHHPDNNKQYTGVVIPDFAAKVKTCVEAHEKMCPTVPLVGWDLALTEEAGPCLLEGNLSCNFFKGTFDQKWYFNFMKDALLYCEEREKSKK